MIKIHEIIELRNNYNAKFDWKCYSLTLTGKTVTIFLSQRQADTVSVGRLGVARGGTPRQIDIYPIIMYCFYLFENVCARGHAGEKCLR